MNSSNNISGEKNDDENVKHEQVDCGDKTKYMCACGKVYDHLSSLTSHIEYKTISYTCPHCSKVFIGPQTFKYHLDNRICAIVISDDDDNNSNDDDDDDGDDDNDDDDDENKYSSKSSLHDSSPSRTSVPSNAKGIVIIISL